MSLNWSWISKSDHMPSDTRPVLVMMDAGFATNHLHPGHTTGGKWIEIARRGAALNGAVLLDHFTTEFAQTGMATHWMELPALTTGEPATAWPQRAVSVRVASNPELEALRRFHDYFLDRCEGLFFACGWPAVELFNAAAAARRGELGGLRRNAIPK